MNNAMNSESPNPSSPRAGMLPTTLKAHWHGAMASPWAMLLPILVLGIINLFWGERIPAGEGLGYDGLKYADMVRNLPAMFHGDQLNSYYAQRVVPALIVRGLIRLARQPFDTLVIIQAFAVYNLVLLLAACATWWRIAKRVRLSLRGRWIGFAGLFVTFACAKQAFYYPVLTDVTALLIGLLLLLCYLQRYPVALCLVTIVGAFVWPVVGVTGACLLLFMDVQLPATLVVPRARTVWLRRGAAALYMVLLVVAVAAYCKLTGGNVDSVTLCELPVWVSRWLGPGVVPCSFEAAITGFPSVVAAGLGLVALLGGVAPIRFILASVRRLKALRIALAVLALGMPYAIVKAISNPALENPSGLRYMLEFMLLPPPGKFLLPFVTLAVFWGPMLVLMVMYWKQCCMEIRRLGVGVMVAIALAIPLALANEPRFITIAWPFGVLAMTRALERARLRNGFVGAFSLLAVLAAQFWLPINVSPWNPPDHAGLLEFPKQLFFMHYGLWMSWLSYSIQLPVILAGVLWLWRQVGGFRESRDVHDVA